MKNHSVIITGATGFVGRHVVNELRQRNIAFTALVRDIGKAKKLPWLSDTPVLPWELGNGSFNPTELSSFDTLIHLAWEGLPYYENLTHIERGIGDNANFLKKAIDNGIENIVVTGTCLEYGKKDGQLCENEETNPTTPYGIGKDTVRRYLQCLQQTTPFTLKWIRLFYMYGVGQNENSLFAALDRAISSGQNTFDLSSGEQIRDYLPVQEVARRVVQIALTPKFNGVINCCSGNPTSIRKLVENYVADRKANIKLNFGKLGYRNYESLAFWGDTSLYNSISGNSAK